MYIRALRALESRDERPCNKRVFIAFHGVVLVFDRNTAVSRGSLLEWNLENVQFSYPLQQWQQLSQLQQQMPERSEQFVRDGAAMAYFVYDTPRPYTEFTLRRIFFLYPTALCVSTMFVNNGSRLSSVA